MVGKNEQGEQVVIQYMIDEAGEKFKRVITFQKNGWIRTNDYYEDGTVTETYERGE